jgi:hypothetical protein
VYVYVYVNVYVDVYVDVYVCVYVYCVGQTTIPNATTRKLRPRCHLDIPVFTRTDQLLVHVDFHRLQRVCVRFFKFALGVSGNGLYYKAYRGETESRLRHTIAATQSEKVVKIKTWLISIAEIYETAPNADIVVLPFLSKV